MKYNLFAPIKQRKGRLAITLTASLIFHGSLVGVAALWPRHQVPVRELPPVDLVPAPAGYGDPLPTTPESSTPEPSVEPISVPPLSTPSVADNNTPPLDPSDALEPTLSTPSPRPAATAVRLPRTQTHPIQGQAAPRESMPANGGSGQISTNHPRSAVRWSTGSKPAYPSALKAAGVQGNGTVRINTDASGRVVSAMMVQSTGNSSLDENTCRHARVFWSGPANASIVVSIAYQLH